MGQGRAGQRGQQRGARGEEGRGQAADPNFTWAERSQVGNCFGVDPCRGPLWDSRKPDPHPGTGLNYSHILPTTRPVHAAQDLFDTCMYGNLSTSSSKLTSILLEISLSISAIRRQ